MSTSAWWDVELRGGRHSHPPGVVRLPYVGTCVFRPVDLKGAGIFAEEYRITSIDDEQMLAVAEYAGLRRTMPLYPIGKRLDPARIPS